MKIISWNLNHRTLEKPIPSSAVAFFKAYSPDIISLNEYVDCESRSGFRQDLLELGYSRQFVSPKIGNHNQVFIASKIDMRLGDIAPPDFDGSSITNFLHVKLVDHELELVGFRAPAYKLLKERNDYWKQISGIVSGLGERKIILLGDINYDPFSGVSASTPEIRFTLSSAFKIPNPGGEWSYISIDGKNKSRIDHAIVSDQVHVSDVKYISIFNDIVLAGSKNDKAITDHAVLSLTVSVE